MNLVGTFAVIALVVGFDSVTSMTREQLKKTLTIIKKQCMPKHGVSDDLVADIERGKFIEDPKVMCYVTCIYQSLQVLRNNRLNKDLVMKQVDNLYPQDMKVPVKASIRKCIHLQDDYADTCAGVFFAAKCLYETDPDNFVFP